MKLIESLCTLSPDFPIAKWLGGVCIPPLLRARKDTTGQIQMFWAKRPPKCIREVDEPGECSEYSPD